MIAFVCVAWFWVHFYHWGKKYSEAEENGRRPHSIEFNYLDVVSGCLIIGSLTDDNSTPVGCVLLETKR